MTSSPTATTSTLDGSARRTLRRLGAFISIAAVVVLGDQWTKSLVRARLEYGETWPDGWTLIRFTHVENTGAAFGILQGASSALTVVTLIAIAGITFVLFAMPSRSRFHTIALSAILGGAVGNLIDRVRIGAVTDFIDPTHYPAFNIADSAIVCGVATLLLVMWFEPETPSKSESSS